MAQDKFKLKQTTMRSADVGGLFSIVFTFDINKSMLDLFVVIVPNYSEGTMKRENGFTLIKKALSSSAVWSLLVILIVIVSESALAQVKEEWVARYNGPGNGSDEASALAADAGGNAYVTGSSDRLGGVTSFDYATIKLVPNDSDSGGGGDSRSGKGTTCFISAIAN